MRIIIRTKDIHLLLPIPLRMAGFAIRFIPESSLRSICTSLPSPLKEQIDKKLLLMLYKEYYSILRDYHGLEIVQVKAEDTFVSIKL